MDRDTITTGQGDVAHVSLEIVDSAGTVVPTGDNLVRFTLAGSGTLALDNANLRDLDPYRPDRRRAFNGRGLAILRAAQPGTVVLTAAADGLRPATITVHVARGAPSNAIPPAR